jgi:hypothetical protein
MRPIQATFLLLVLGCAAADPSSRRSDGVAAVPLRPTTTIEEQARALSLESRPGPAHQVLDALVGEWDVSLSAMNTTGSETDPFRGKASLAWTLGKRFLRWDASVDFGGTPGTTTGFLGFDTRTRDYQLMMISDFATGMQIARGGGELRGTGVVFDLEQTDPTTGARLIARSRLRTLAPDHFVLEQLERAADGREHVSRVWHYRRSVLATR